MGRQEQWRDESYEGQCTPTTNFKKGTGRSGRDRTGDTRLRSDGRTEGVKGNGNKRWDDRKKQGIVSWTRERGKSEGDRGFGGVGV